MARSYPYKREHPKFWMRGRDLSIEVIERFSVPEPNSGCWLWLHTIGGTGYGMLSVHRKMMRAHRASWIAHNGQIPDGMVVCHKCDTRSCVNPDHLFVGTTADNVADKIRKGRAFDPKPGLTKRAYVKLTEQFVREIRASHLPAKELARVYGILPRTIRRVRSGERWGHVT